MTDVEDLTVIIPVYNDPAGLQTTLDSLTNTVDDDVQILIIDNNSVDSTMSVSRKFVRSNQNIELEVEKDRQSSYAARNQGIEKSHTEFLCFLDADLRVSQGWYQRAIETMKDINGHYLSPKIEVELSENSGLAARYNATSGFPNQQFIEKHHYAPTACLFVTRDLINKVGYFDDRLVSGGDLEFGNRVHEAGYELHYTPEITVYHPVRESFRELIRRNIRIGRGHCQLQRYYPHRYGRVGIPPRPDRIRLDTYDETMNKALFTAITILMTGTRGVGYYLEALSGLRSRFNR